MKRGIIAILSLLVRDYIATVPAPAPPSSAPPPSPLPPAPSPTLSFSATQVSPLCLMAGAPVVNEQIAGTNTNEASITLVINGLVPTGIAVTHDNSTPSSGALKINGTPTQHGEFAFTAHYVRNSDNVVVGSTRHEIYVLDATKVLTIGNMANPVLRQDVDVPAIPGIELCTLSANFGVDITANSYASQLPIGLGTRLEWTFDALSGSGKLFLKMPNSAFARTGFDYVSTLTFVYRDHRGRVLGTSAHNVTMLAPWSPAPAPPPAPSPAPPPPAVSCPAAPAPSPAPIPQPDPTVGTLARLFHFDTATENASTNPPAISNLIDEMGGQPLSGFGMLVSGYRGSGLSWRLGSSVAAQQSDNAIDCASRSLTVECMVDIRTPQLWTRPGTFVPVVSLLDPMGVVLWALGFVAAANLAPGSFDPAYAIPAFAVGTRNLGVAVGGGILINPYVVALGDTNGFLLAPEASQRFFHLAGVVKRGVSAVEVGVWMDGVGDNAALSFTSSGLGIPWAVGCRLQVGGVCQVFGPSWSSVPASRIAPFAGIVDELRIKQEAVYPISSGRTQTFTVPPMPFSST